MGLVRRAAVALFSLTVGAHAQPSQPSGDLQVAPAVNSRRACSPGNWSPPSRSGALGVQAILKDLPSTARWADLPLKTRERLQELAEDRLAAFRASWGGEALQRKLKILLDCPTPAMSSAIDEYYRVTFKSVVPSGFKLESVRNADFRRALVKAYLGSYAIGRAGMTYPNAALPNRDWDGVSAFDSVLLPDRRAFRDWKVYFAEIKASLQRIDSGALTEIEKALRQQVLFLARAGAEGALFGDSFGGSDLETACERVGMHNAVVMAYKGDRGRPIIFANDDEVLREVNAMYSSRDAVDLKWLDRGNVNSAINNRLCSGNDQNIDDFVNSDADGEVAKGIKLIKGWWVERLLDNPESRRKCTAYSEEDRRSTWEAFNADQRSNEDGSSTMTNFRSQLAGLIQEKRTQYRETATLALMRVFPDDAVLTASQRKVVIAAIDRETAFGVLTSTIAGALDAAQGVKDGPASRIWNEAVKRNVKTLGGYRPGEPLRPDDEAKLFAMYAEVRRWVSNRYAGYPVNVGATFTMFKFKATTGNNAFTSSATGDVDFGIGTNRSLMEIYSIILHEVRHAVTGAWRANAPDKSSVALDEGAAVEGSGVAVEELLVRTFLRETLKDDLAFALYTLDFGIRDARIIGTTDATLQKYFRPGCADPTDLDTIEFAKTVAATYGLSGDLATNLTLRSHAGAQYFQYVSGGLQILDDIAYLQDQLGPASKVRLDPFVLFACNLNTPVRSASYVADLKTCLSRRP